VIVLNWPVLGGSERQALQLARHLARVEGAEVEVRALTADDGRAVQLFRAEHIPWKGRRVRLRRGKTRTFATLAGIALDLRRARPDVLLPFCDLPNVACGLVWRYTGATTCIWNQRDVLAYTLGDDLARRAVRNTPVLVSNSCHGAMHVVDELSVPEGRVCVVPNGVELPPARASRAEWRARLGANEDDFVVCALAHFHEQKDHGTLVRAWRGVVTPLAEEGRTGILVLAGRDDGHRESVESLVAELELEQEVRFAGDVDDVAGLLGSVEAGVLSSRAEGCPNAVLECMAAGLAVAGTDVAGVREAVGEDGLPFLAPAGDADALGAALLQLAGDPELRRGLGERYRDRVRAHFDADTMLDQYVALILASLRRGGSLPTDETR
jgi:glycosyltransferase involved in cell wall biosynthesis